MSEVRPIRAKWFSGHKRLLWSTGLISALLLIWLMQPAEPRYQGKSLSYWLRQMDDRRHFSEATGHFAVNEAAGRPVREMGESVVPLLVDRLQTGLSAARWRNRLAALGWKLPSKVLGSRLDERSADSRQACLGFMALREKGAEAVPALVSMAALNEENSALIFETIASIGAPGALAISNGLVDQRALVRLAAAQAAGLLREDGAPLVPILGSILSDSNALQTVRCATARSLGMIGRPVDLVVSALREALKSTDNTLRADAVFSLLVMHQAAKSPVPEIKALLLREAQRPAHERIPGLVIRGRVEGRETFRSVEAGTVSEKVAK